MDVEVGSELGGVDRFDGGLAMIFEVGRSRNAMPASDLGPMHQ